MNKLVFMVLCWCCQLNIVHAEPTQPVLEWDELHVTGINWKINRQLKQALRVMVNDVENTITLNRTTFEDAFMVLDNEVKRLGYLQPAFVCILTPKNGNPICLEWQDGDTVEFPIGTMPALLTAVKFQVIPGKLFYYENISISGLSHLSKQEISSFFHPVGQWIVSKRDRYYTPLRFNQSLQRIINVLKESGYRNAKVIDQSSQVDEATGAVSVKASLQLGALHYIDSIIIETEADALPNNPFTPTLSQATLFSPTWLAQYMYSVKRHYQAQGYVDAETASFIKELQATAERIDLQLIIQLKQGSPQWVGQITFTGDQQYNPGFLHKQLPLRAGQRFDPAKVEQARTYLQRLRQFESVDVEYTNSQEQIRDVVFNLKPLPRDSITLIGGIGSYDIVRAGIQWERLNLWGLAHRAELELLQSLRMSQVDYNYTIPQLWGTSIDCFATTHALFREEISFERQEWGVSVGARYPWKKYNTQLTAQFNYESLTVLEQDFLPEDGLEEATVSSLEFRIRKNELDNPIYPTAGYQIFASMELAFPAIGGDVEYQRLELGGAYHHSIVDGLTGRFGLKQGLITSFDSSAANIPFNRRFFLGGENTVRGYRSGEASPVDAQSKEIGAAAYTLLQVELEQKINHSVSLVVLSDSVALSEESDDFTSPEWLHSIGVGVRVRTFLGPLRCEYAHNINPRAFDPRGSLQFGLGMPF